MIISIDTVDRVCHVEPDTRDEKTVTNRQEVAAMLRDIAACIEAWAEVTPAAKYTTGQY